MSYSEYICGLLKPITIVEINLSRVSAASPMHKVQPVDLAATQLTAKDRRSVQHPSHHPVVQAMIKFANCDWELVAEIDGQVCTCLFACL